METYPQGWEREFDRTGRRIREDVREAGRKVWAKVRMKVRTRLCDGEDADEIMEAAVDGISRYLNKLNLPEDSASPEGLLLHAVRRRVLKGWRKQNRLVPLEEAATLPDPAPFDEWTLEIERRADLPKILRQLSPRGCTICLLRLEGVCWPRIGEYLGIPESTAQNSFWRELRQAQIKLGINPRR